MWRGHSSRRKLQNSSESRRAGGFWLLGNHGRNYYARFARGADEGVRPYTRAIHYLPLSLMAVALASPLSYH